MEYSKKLSKLIMDTAIIVTILAIVFPILGLPADGLFIALPYVWGAVGVVQTFYYWKSKNDNRHKYAMRYVDKIADKYGIEVAIRIAEVVLKD